VIKHGLAVLFFAVEFLIMHCTIFVCCSVFFLFSCFFFVICHVFVLDLRG